jgi:hypothetical protein
MLNILRKQNFIFSLMKDDIKRMVEEDKDIDIIMSYIEEAAKYAWENNIALLDTELDQVIFQLSRKNEVHKIRIENISTNKDIIKVLHVATLVPEVGGHARVIQNWVTQDVKNEHHLIITKQQEKNLILNDIINHVNSFTNVPKNLKLDQKACFLTKLINNIKPNIIIIHTHPYDALSAFVFSKYENIPVVFFNHADHVFSLGRSLCHFICSFRQIANVTLKKSGYNVLKTLLPLPAVTRDFQQKKEKFTKDKYLISMASSYKFRMNKDIDFFKTWDKILKRNRDYRLLIIGVSENEINDLTDSILNPNISLLGRIPNPQSIIKNADYFIEPFPIGTGLGTVEAILLGTPPIFNYKDLSIYQVGAKSLFNNSNKQKLPNYSTEEQYINWVTEELESNNYKSSIFPIFYKMVFKEHSLNWSSNLAKIYNEVFTSFNEKELYIPMKVNPKEKFFYERSISFESNKTSVKDYFWRLRRLPSFKRKLQALYFFFESSIQEKNFSGIKTIIKLIFKP